MLRRDNTHNFFSKSRNFSGAHLNIDKSLPGVVFALKIPCPSRIALPSAKNAIAWSRVTADPGPAAKTNR
ncbi:hypothetical protein RAD16_00285 [Bradyrhizobium sp. 18BD]